MKPRTRLQLHSLRTETGAEIYYWQVRSMEGQVLVESPMYLSAEQAEDAIRLEHRLPNIQRLLKSR